MDKFGFYIIPIILAIIILTGLFKKVPIFEEFLSGASEGINSAFSIAPSLIGLITAVTMLKTSGSFDVISSFLHPIANFLKIPPEIIPLAILKPISGSGSIALLDSILKNFGPNEKVSKLASVISGSTETTFYTLTVYFGAVKVKKTRHAVPSAIIADITAIVISAVLINLF